MSAYPDPPEVELPEPHVSLVLWRVCLEAHLSTMPRKRAERFLRAVASKLAEEQSLAELFHIRAQTEWAAVQRARRQAAELFKRYLPIFTARLPKD